MTAPTPASDEHFDTVARVATTAIAALRAVIELHAATVDVIPGTHEPLWLCRECWAVLTGPDDACPTSTLIARTLAVHDHPETLT